MKKASKESLERIADAICSFARDWTYTPLQTPSLGEHVYTEIKSLAEHVGNAAHNIGHVAWAISDVASALESVADAIRDRGAK
jgi:methyl-accepting chemotaxis protein